MLPVALTSEYLFVPLQVHAAALAVPGRQDDGGLRVHHDAPRHPLRLLGEALPKQCAYGRVPFFPESAF